MADDREDDRVPTLKLEKTRLGLGDVGAKPPSSGASPARSSLPLPPPSVEIEVTACSPATGSSGAMPPPATERYSLLEVLGQGGMGEVLLGVDEHIGREVAVKRIRSASPSKEQIARFVREARVQGRLEHPAIVPVHDLAVDRDRRPYFVMKRVSGTDMHTLLARMRRGETADEMTERRHLLRAFADVCLAVEFAHSKGIIHRDLKPANIMLGDYGEVYILDWGVARTVDTFDELPTRAANAQPSPPDSPLAELDVPPGSGDTRAGELLGTPAYMAPEQLAGDPVGPAADIYALGCILFEIAAGEPLHPRTRTVGQALTLADARPSQRRPDSPPELDGICLRATAIEEGDRFASARALGAAVQAYLDGNRDVVVRRELAQQHVDQARAAIARSTDEDGRVVAMREAGRALALDPTSTEAADIVTRLMLQPPREVPAEVDAELGAREMATARTQGRLAAISLLGYLAYVPFLLWTGVEQPLIVVAMALLSIAGAVQIYVFTRGERISPPQVYLNATINALLIALVSRMVGPFIVVPMLVVSTLGAFAAHPAFGRIRIVSLILVAAIAVPWLLELAGILERTYAIEDGKIVIASPTVTFQSVPTQLAFALLLVMSTLVVAYLLRSIANQQRDATRRLELHAWHLRQIVPTSVR